MITTYWSAGSCQAEQDGQHMLPLLGGDLPPVVTAELQAATRVVLAADEEVQALYRGQSFGTDRAGWDRWRVQVLEPAKLRRAVAAEDLGRLLGHPVHVFDAHLVGQALLLIAEAGQ